MASDESPFPSLINPVVFAPSLDDVPSAPCVNDEATVCSAAPYKVDAMVQLLPPGEDSPAPGSSQAPSCIVSMQRMAIVVTDEHGSVLASCNTPDDMLAGDGVTSCRWSTDSSTMERTLEATGIGMRERRMPLIVEATMGGVTVAQSQPLDVTASLIGENNLMVRSLAPLVADLAHDASMVA